MRFSSLILQFPAAAVQALDLDGYEYVVVGSGAGKKTLLIDAGDDHGSSANYSGPAYSTLASEDPDMSWNFFVRHYADDEQQARDHKTTYVEGGRRHLPSARDSSARRRSVGGLVRAYHRDSWNVLLVSRSKVNLTVGPFQRTSLEVE